MPDFDIVSYLIGKTSGGGGGMTSKSISGTGTTAVIGSGWMKTDITNAASAVVSVTVYDTTILHLIYSEDIYYSQNGKYMFYFGTVNDALESFECGILFDPATQTFELSEFQYTFETEETSFYRWADITAEVGDWTLTVIGVGGGDGGGGTIVSKTITSNGTYYATSDNADGYSPVIVSVSGDGGEIIFGTSSPSSSTGDNGDTYVQYHPGLKCIVKVNGGRNGGAVITVELDGTLIFTATASDTYNLNYDQTYAEVATSIGTVTVQVTPPDTNFGSLYITVTGPQNSFTSNPPRQGANTSYGYGNYSNTEYLTSPSGTRIADAIFIKQLGTWRGVGDEV